MSDCCAKRKLFIRLTTRICSEIMKLLFTSKLEPIPLFCFDCCNDPKFLDRQVRTNSVDPDQTGPSDQDTHCLQFPLHLLDIVLYGKATLFKF